MAVVVVVVEDSLEGGVGEGAGSPPEGRGSMSGIEDVSGAANHCECDAGPVEVEVSLPGFGCDSGS